MIIVVPSLGYADIILSPFPIVITFIPFNDNSFFISAVKRFVTDSIWYFSLLETVPSSENILRYLAMLFITDRVAFAIAVF